MGENEKYIACHGYCSEGIKAIYFGLGFERMRAMLKDTKMYYMSLWKFFFSLVCTRCLALQNAKHLEVKEQYENVFLWRTLPWVFFVSFRFFALPHIASNI